MKRLEGARPNSHTGTWARLRREDANGNPIWGGRVEAATVTPGDRVTLASKDGRETAVRVGQIEATITGGPFGDVTLFTILRDGESASPTPGESDTLAALKVRVATLEKLVAQLINPAPGPATNSASSAEEHDESHLPF